MMKNTIKYIFVVAVALAMGACTKEAPSKAEVEAGFDKGSAALPTVSLGSDVAVDPLAGTAEVQLTISGLTSGLDSLSVGVLSATDPTFKSSYFTKVDNPGDGTVKVFAKVSPNSTWYVRGVAACTAGTAYSDLLTVSVPDIPFWQKVPGTFTGKATSYFDGTEYTFNFTIVTDPDDQENSVVINNLDPYFASNGFTAERGYNIFKGKIDEEKNRIVVPIGQSVGYQDVCLNAFDNASPDAAEYYDDLYLQFSPDCLTITFACAFGMDSEGGWHEMYNGGFSVKKQ